MSRTELAVSLLLAAVALYIAAEPQHRSQNFATTVSETVDGDTVEVRGEIDATVRLLGVDTPETGSINHPEEFGMQDSLETRECLEKWGDRAKKFTRKRIDRRNITLELDPEADRRGDYGRLLAYIKIDNISLNQELLSEGYARVYESSFSRIEQYRELETEARTKNRGLWQCTT